MQFNVVEKIHIYSVLDRFDCEAERLALKNDLECKINDDVGVAIDIIDYINGTYYHESLERLRKICLKRINECFLERCMSDKNKKKMHMLHDDAKVMVMDYLVKCLLSE